MFDCGTGLRFVTISIFALATMTDLALAQIAPPPDSDVLLIREAGRDTSGVFSYETEGPGSDVVFAQQFPLQLHRVVNFGAAPPNIGNTIINLMQRGADPDTAGTLSDIVAMKVTTVNPTTLAFDFNYWSEAGTITAANFLNQLNLVAPRTITRVETGSAEDLSGVLFPGGIPGNLRQIIFASDVNNTLDQLGGDAVGGGGAGGFGAPFISDRTIFFKNNQASPFAAADETPAPGDPPPDPTKAIYDSCPDPTVPASCHAFTLPQGASLQNRLIRFTEDGEVNIVGDPNGMGDDQVLSDLLAMKVTQGANANCDSRIAVPCNLQIYFWSEDLNVSEAAFLASVFPNGPPAPCQDNGQDYDEMGHPDILRACLFQNALDQNGNPLAQLPFDRLENKSDPTVAEPGTLILFGVALGSLGLIRRRKPRIVSKRI